ncbi:MAG: SIMPL domain-containing protein [Rickettsiaceae bacterium]|nr:SIMPL domain-containing protein [Rickettsiaceae bacterium]
MESSSNGCKKSCLPIVIVGLFLAFGIALSGFFISKTIYNAKVALNTAEVKGLAVRRVKSDRANWVIVFKNTTNSRQDIPELYNKSEKDQRTIIKLLEKNGFQEQEIELGVLDYVYQEFRDENQKLVDEKHQLIGSISIETNKVELVSKVRTKINKLIAEGIDVENRAPAYRFTKLNEIKPEMLREATKNARDAANEFAKNAGVTVGGIRDARQGGFNIRDDGQDYGDTNKIDKDARVVTTITFYLTE